MNGSNERSPRRFGGGLKLAAFALTLAAVFALSAVVGGAIDPNGDAQSGPEEDDAMLTMNETESNDASAEGGLAIAQDGYRLEIDRTRFEAGERATLSFRIIGSDGVVTAFEEEHEAPLHLIVVRRDLSGFQHLHPHLDGAGTWSTPLKLPAGGVYRAYADFETGGHALTLGADLFAAGEFDPVDLPVPRDGAAADGYEVEMASADGMLDFTVSRDGRPVTDLQPYLGARGHLVAIRDGDLAYIHVHPDDAEADPGTIAFHAELAAAGRYRLFLQFRHDGEVHTVAFTEEVSG